MKCATSFCRGHARGDSSRFCCKCLSRQYKARHPLNYSFNKLRQRARERGHVFTLTLAEYIDLATSTGYADGKGKSSQSLSLDRINPARGYEPGNLRVVTLQENSRLRWAPLPAHLRASYEEAQRECA